MTTVRRLFGKRIQNLRKKRGLTQAELAEECGLSNNFIASMERGATAPSMETLDKLARVLHTDISALFDFEADASRAGKMREVVRLISGLKDKRELDVIAQVAGILMSLKSARP